jgi:2'-5' RNA ligase
VGPLDQGAGRQHVKFDWATASDASRAAVVAESDPDAVPDVLTAVVRIPDEIGQRLASLARQLCTEGGAHYPYPSESLHFTVLSLRRAADSASSTGAVQRFVEALGGSPPPEVSLRGLRVGERTVWVPALSEGRAIEGLAGLGRRAVFGQSYPGAPGEADRVRSPHVNIVRFREAPDQRLRDAVLRADETDFGRFRAARILVVTCNKVMSPSSTRVVARVTLGR